MKNIRINTPDGERTLILPLSSATLKAVCPECKRQGIKPFDSAPLVIPPKTTALYSGIPQDVFRPKKLIITAPDPLGLYICDIRIGNISQTSANGRISVAEFLEEKSPELRIDVANVAQVVSVAIENATGESRVCEVFFMGESVRL